MASFWARTHRLKIAFGRRTPQASSLAAFGLMLCAFACRRSHPTDFHMALSRLHSHDFMLHAFSVGGAWHYDEIFTLQVLSFFSLSWSWLRSNLAPQYTFCVRFCRSQDMEFCGTLGPPKVARGRWQIRWVIKPHNDSLLGSQHVFIAALSRFNSPIRMY